MYAGKIFHENFVINDFLDKKRIIPHMEIFTLELPAPYTLEFLKTGYEWVLDVNIFTIQYPVPLFSLCTKSLIAVLKDANQLSEETGAVLFVSREIIRGNIIKRAK